LVNFEKTIPVKNDCLLALKESSVTSGINLFTIFQEICAENGLNWRRFLVGHAWRICRPSSVCVCRKFCCYIHLDTWCYAHRLFRDTAVRKMQLTYSAIWNLYTRLLQIAKKEFLGLIMHRKQIIQKKESID